MVRYLIKRREVKFRDARFEVFTALKSHALVFWVVTSKVTKIFALSWEMAKILSGRGGLLWYISIQELHSISGKQ
jgi:hypothetical protein